jgi:hypothetical protein
VEKKFYEVVVMTPKRKPRVREERHLSQSHSESTAEPGFGPLTPRQPHVPSTSLVVGS